MGALTHECRPRLHDNGEYRCMDGECREPFIKTKDAWKHVEVEVIENEDVIDGTSNKNQ